jgi:hypothetical protein
LKLAVPVENHHHAFCTKGCHESFYLNRCRVCEADLRKKGKRGDPNRLYCRAPNDCKARLVLGGGRYHLRMPVTRPALSWVDLDEAKHRAEEISLANLPLFAGVNVETAELKRINGANGKPHPMGPALNLPPPISASDTGAASNIAFTAGSESLLTNRPQTSRDRIV